MCHSCLTDSAPGYLQPIIFGFKFLFARSAEEGSISLVCAAAAGEESHGEYMSECLVKAPARLVLSDEGVKAQKQVWDELVQRLEVIQPGISDNIAA